MIIPKQLEDTRFQIPSMHLIHRRHSQQRPFSALKIKLMYLKNTSTVGALNSAALKQIDDA